MMRLQASPWADGLSTLADAIAGAPANRANALWREQQAANLAADNARADAALRLQQEQAQREIEKWAFDKGLKTHEDRRSAELHPWAVKQAEASLETSDLANEFARQNNPLQLQGKQTAINLENARIGALPETAASMADAVMGNVSAKMPKFDLGASLKAGGSGLPPIVTLPGLTQGAMDFGGYGDTAGMDDIQHRMDMRDQIGSLADSAVLSDKSLNTAQWIADQSKAFGGADGYRPITPEERQAYGIDPAAPVYMDANNKPTVLDNARPTGFRPATAEEKQSFGLKPDAPLVIDMTNGKPSILSDGKTTVNVGNAPETQIAVAMKDRYDIGRASSAALDALDNAQAALPGAITGAAANQRLALQKIGSLLGVADTSSITDTETFRSAMQPVVAAALHATVGSSQISDADREFAARAAAGDITLDETSIQRLINITRAANTAIVRQYNESLDGVYPDDGTHTRERALYNVPQAPQFSATPLGPQQPQMPQVNPDDMQLLLSDPSPEAQAEFDAHYGAGAAARILTGRQ